MITVATKNILEKSFCKRLKYTREEHGGARLAKLNLRPTLSEYYLNRSKCQEGVNLTNKSPHTYFHPRSCVYSYLPVHRLIQPHRRFILFYIDYKKKLHYITLCYIALFVIPGTLCILSHILQYVTFFRSSNKRIFSFARRTYRTIG